MKSPGPEPETELARVVERNIRALLERRRSDDREKTAEQRVVHAITRFTGSMAFIYLHLALYGLWVAINLGWIEPWPKFDPSFAILAMTASVEAIFLSTFVLITQNRMAAIADKRADLDLQISLLAEHEITRLLTLTAAMARRMGIEESMNPELKELQKDIQPETVLETMERREREFNSDTPTST